MVFFIQESDLNTLGPPIKVKGSQNVLTVNDEYCQLLFKLNVSRKSSATNSKDSDEEHSFDDVNVRPSAQLLQERELVEHSAQFMEQYSHFDEDGFRK